jgi:hypothetical protein
VPPLRKPKYRTTNNKRLLTTKLTLATRSSYLILNPRLSLHCVNVRLCLVGTREDLGLYYKRQGSPSIGATPSRLNYILHYVTKEKDTAEVFINMLPEPCHHLFHACTTSNEVSLRMRKLWIPEAGSSPRYTAS